MYNQSHSCKSHNCSVNSHQHSNPKTQVLSSIWSDQREGDAYVNGRREENTGWSNLVVCSTGLWERLENVMTGYCSGNGLIILPWLPWLSSNTDISILHPPNQSSFVFLTPTIECFKWSSQHVIWGYSPDEHWQCCNDPLRSVGGSRMYEKYWHCKDISKNEKKVNLVLNLLLLYHQIQIGLTREYLHVP